ncbi:MAG: SufS family cysteine desulfurase [Candidatus Micrarchaeota archaeon]|nr:SufS family cysteine desulfurase [Candidatus Micrarchaeota archaeon]
MFDTDRIRNDFPILGIKVNGKPFVYLDSAATSQKPLSVIKAVDSYYRTYNSNIHRGLYSTSVKATDEYVRSKELAAKLVNAGSYRNVIYCRNTTDAINIVALSWGEANIRKGDHILITDMEHHSNIVPWLMLAKRKGAVLDHVQLKGKESIDMEDLRKKLELKPKIFAFCHVSNVLGSINDAKGLTKLAHEAGAKVLVDAAQSVPHMPVDFKDIGCDFLAFSPHKMLGPAGLGVLCAGEELLDGITPAIVGSDMIRTVTFDSADWNELPWKFESGTPNMEGGIGFGAAIEYLNGIGMEKVRQHEMELTSYALKRLQEQEDITIYGYGAKNVAKRGGVISFNIKGAHPHDVASIFNSDGIAIRAGHHCAMPLVNQVLCETAVSRMSFYIYNKPEEIDKAIEAVGKVRKVLRLATSQ